MYGIADMIDDFEAGTEAGPTSKLSMKKHLAVMMPCFTIGPKLTMANKMKTMREELKGITEQYQKFMLVSGTKDDELEVIQMRETSSTIEASIIGRTEEENKIWVSLCEIMIEELIVLAIHGIGGLGKTTLAKMIYNNKTKFEDYFRVWIYVSEKFDLNKIGNSLISQLSENESTYTEKQMIHRSLAQLFTNKKILIILDDLWAEDDSQLDSLVAMLKVGQGSKVVVIATTRNEEIARKISTIPSYELASLTNEMCWTIIKQKSGFESRDDKEQLNDVGEAIAAKCGGVALAAQSIGSILETMTSNQWKKVRDSDIWKVSNSSLDPKDKAATRVLASLRLSYTFMPRYLKLCFAYLAIFPKGCNISKGDLIHQWISLSFIGATPTFTAWELGEIYITQLLKLSFLEHSKHERLLFDDTDVTAFTMHDLVHDLARSVMDDEILLAGNDDNIGGNRCHYALLNNCSKSLESRRIRAIRFMGLAEIGHDDAAFAYAKSLRVLDLSECSIHKLTNSIGRLKQLRYLNAPRVRHEVIPDSITRLSKLLYLSLRGSSLYALPGSIGEMKGLMYLDLSRCKRIKELPESFRRLKKLSHFDLSNCSALENILKFMWSLTDLQYLNLSGCCRIGSLPESLDGLSSLQYLNLCGCFRQGEYLMDSISTLSSLEHLDLSRNDGITSLPESFGNLIKLHTLKLSYWYKIQKIPKSIGRIDTLKTIYLDGVYGLHEELVPHPSTSFVPLPNFMVRVRDGESSSNLVCLKDTNPEKLYIFWLQNVKSAEEAQSIKLMEKNNLLTLELSWTQGAERFVDDKVLLEKLVPPKSLQYLKITGYNGVSLPTWVGQQNSWVRLMGMRHLEELSVSASNGMLSIKDCPKLKMGPLLPRAVCMLEINSSDNVLSSWGECRMSSTPECASSSSSFSSSVSTIHTLAVGYSELPMQQWRLLRHISGLEALTIESCPDMIVSHDIIPHLSSVKYLTIIRCNISSLPHWVMDLTGLKELSIVYCEGMRSLPEGIQQLTKLETLYIAECPDLKKWCESDENKMKLAHIKDKRF
ncbi:putative disease resistance protein RGA1 [Hordeum vulgare subsp. vulgare]|uniref:putative disease resistance protein RGA1 n=1 Tax=Hordeum vulgare subsp. vulgare TaxID=112509 RepID=UPI001D1A53C9|nr:putative disease resistance protein RGA1 [Hordeum vulgare subsp. vulgare]